MLAESIFRYRTKLSKVHTQIHLITSVGSSTYGRSVRNCVLMFEASRIGSGPTTHRRLAVRLWPTCRSDLLPCPVLVRLLVLTASPATREKADQSTRRRHPAVLHAALLQIVVILQRLKRKKRNLHLNAVRNM